MSTQPFMAFIRPGVNEQVIEINVRNGPGTNYAIAFQATTGQQDLSILNVSPDDEGRTQGGKVYQWFRLKFPDNRIGWVRDDLIDMRGNGTTFGYGIVMGRTFAFELTRADANPPQRRKTISAIINEALRQHRDDTEEPDPPSDEDEEERIVKTAFNITSAFEGGGYSAYQTYDQGIISYGRFQFTLQSGNLAAVINRYIATSNSMTAQALRDDYQARLNMGDATLRQDERLQTLLQQAAVEKAMQAAQDGIAYERFWLVVYNLSITPRGIQTPLAQAMFFDIGIQHGTQHGLFTRAENELGVPNKSKVGNNGASETMFAQHIAEIRQEILYRIAERDNVPGVKKRADFWLDMINKGDWNLAGDGNGELLVLGKRVQVRNP